MAGITVDVNARITGYQEQIQLIREALRQVGEDSDIGRGLVRSLQQAQRAVNAFSLNANKRFTTNQGLEKMQDQAANIDKMFAEMGDRLSKISWSDLTTELDQQMSSIIARINEVSQAYSQNMVAGIKQAVNQSSDLQKVFSELKINPDKMDVTAITDRLGSAIEDAKNNVQSLQKEYDDLGQKAQEAASKVQAIQNLPAMKQTQTGLMQDVKSMFQNVDFSFSNGALKEYVHNFQRDFRRLEDVSNEARNRINNILSELGSAKTAQEARTHLTELANAYKELGNGSLARQTSSFRQLSQLMNSLIPKPNTAQQIKTLTNSLNDFFNTYDNLQMSDEMQARIQNLLQPDATVQEIKNAEALVTTAIKDYFTNLQNVAAAEEKSQKNFETQQTKTGKDLVAAQQKEVQYQDATAEFTSRITSLENDNDNLRQEIEKLREQLNDLVRQQEERNKTKPAAAQAGEKIKNKARDDLAGLKNEVQQYSAELEKVSQQEQALGQINSFIQRWFSATAAIRMVESAFNNIKSTVQELDDVMTEIAIVTDKTQEDLWGQMSEYTAMAKEYAVSIKGVYEVSQLFYQQGLQTSDVMALTEQTLKMAKISGLDYSTATDYMTNAIRSFKMEMTDAQRVVDVYSAIAASSATDTAELATAMSKTASAAESVGSSFENTTAMMAVMIEATRESATNIGSAMKSIISRYGEMKENPAKLIDSEGEEMSLNKVDTALQSVGISLHDAQGQFREFDDVIMELAASWDSIDKNTQRYIATVMAGNR